MSVIAVSCKLSLMAFTSVFSGPATLFCSTNKLTSCKAASCKHFCLQRSPPATAIEVSKSRELSFKIKISSIQTWSNINFCLCCKFQRLVFSEWRDMRGGQTDNMTTVCRGSAPRHNKQFFCCVLVYCTHFMITYIIIPTPERMAPIVCHSLTT